MMSSAIPALPAEDPSDARLALFFLARGFTRIFWGLLVALILFFGRVSIVVTPGMKISAYVVGCALAAWGVWTLAAAGLDSRWWRRCWRATLGLLLLTIYFAPFLEWWKRAPQVPLYLVNVLGLLLASMLTLLLLDLLAADIFRRLEQWPARREALAFGGSVFLLMIAPLVVTVLASLWATIRYQTSFEFEMWRMILHLPIGVYAILTVPCSLTLFTIWKARALCYQRLANAR